jgi:colanic acid biosynthesis glycosyl transferase WcaI
MRGSQPQLIFINRYFFPDHSATSQILSDLAFHLAHGGRDVHILTSRQIYDDPKASLPVEEIVNGVKVHRVSSTRFGRAGLPGRSLDYFSFYRSVWRGIAALARPEDVVIAKTDPPLTAIVAAAAAGRRNARLINWLQDIYPETAVELGVPFMRGPLAAGLSVPRNRTLRAAAATVVVGDLMRQKIEALGAPPTSVHVISNWCNDEEIRPIAPAANPLRRAWGLEGKFVLGYSGNLGRAHEFETLLAAAQRLRDDPRIIFLMIGGGKRFEELTVAVKACGVARAFRFMPYQERKMLPYSLGLPDAHWLSLLPGLEGLIVPSKFYGIAAAGKPTIVIADTNGELARLVRQHGCGLTIAPGDANSLVAVLRRLAREPQTVIDIGARARTMLDARFSRERSLTRWQNLLDSMIRPSSPGRSS